MLNGSVVFVEPPESMKYEASAVKKKKKRQLKKNLKVS